MPSYTMETEKYRDEVSRTRAGVAAKPGLGGDLDELDRSLGTLSQALTALTKRLDPVLGPEESRPELAEGDGSVERAVRDADVVPGQAPLRERVGELAVAVNKILRRIEDLSGRVEL